VRLLLADVSTGRLVPLRYYRKITRLGGGFTTDEGLAPDAMERTLSSLHEIAALLRHEGISKVRAVGTAALRAAPNGIWFTQQILEATGLRIEVIDGDEEARLCARGVLAALSPQPACSLIFDIGGGSSEFLVHRDGQTLFECSYPLGVVALSEEYPTFAQQCARIEQVVDSLCCDLKQVGEWNAVSAPETALVGTAGTVTTLAAIHLSMTVYDWKRVNNLQLDRQTLAAMLEQLRGLSCSALEQIPGMEKGRGDLIVPGLQIVLRLLQRLGKERLTVSDFGILEGVLLTLAQAEARSGALRD